MLQRPLRINKTLWYWTVPAVGLLWAHGALAETPARSETASSPYVVVLGTAQDAGYPQAGCDKACCRVVWRGERARGLVASLAIVDPDGSKRWLVDATPDFREQLHMLDSLVAPDSSPGLEGIFLTHAHIGHYTGLMHLGREGMGARDVAVFAMPRMKTFLESNGPWSLLVALGNIRLRPLQADQAVALTRTLSVTPLIVPHRDEFSETAGFLIAGPQRRVLYIPDIDKWQRWDRRIEDLLRTVDVALLDGTFFADGEVPGRNMAEIPHPFIVESLQRFASLPSSERRKVYFIHLNHTNPAWKPDSPARLRIERLGCHIARRGMRFTL